MNGFYKAFIVAFGLYIAGTIFYPFANHPAWFENPHGAFLGIKQNTLYKTKFDKPDLTRIKETIYEPFRITVKGQTYRGLISVKPGEGGAEPKVGGAVYKDARTEAIGILEGRLIDKDDHYEVQLSSKNAASLFNAKKAYREKTDFPLALEIRTNPKNGEIYLTAPLYGSAQERADFYSIQEGMQKKYIGKWQANDFYTKWDFEFKALPNDQVSGFAYKSIEDVRKCAYAVLGIPSSNGRMIIMTGEAVENQNECGVLSWQASAENDSVRFEPYNTTGPSFGASRE